VEEKTFLRKRGGEGGGLGALGGRGRRQKKKGRRGSSDNGTRSIKKKGLVQGGRRGGTAPGGRGGDQRYLKTRKTHLLSGLNHLSKGKWSRGGLWEGCKRRPVGGIDRKGGGHVLK